MSDHSAAEEGLSAWALPGIPEVSPGDDLAALIGEALRAEAERHPGREMRNGDVVVVTSKIMSKAEGRIIQAADRQEAIEAETVRVVATRPRPDGDGETRIVENRLGIVGAAAGVDASNTAEGTVLLLPQDPDASAEVIRSRLSAAFGVALGVVVTDTLGRAWRMGQTDIAIGAAGLHVVHDHRGGRDAHGQPLDATQIAVADELAATADLVKGKSSGRPVAVLRGVGHLVAEQNLPTPGARSLVRTGPGDMFRLGTDEAIAEGYRQARAELSAEFSADSSADQEASDSRNKPGHVART